MKCIHPYVNMKFNEANFIIYKLISFLCTLAILLLLKLGACVIYIPPTGKKKGDKAHFARLCPLG